MVCHNSGGTLHPGSSDMGNRSYEHEPHLKLNTRFSSRDLQLRSRPIRVKSQAFERILEHANPHLRIAARMIRATGITPIAMCRLDIEDIDLTGRCLDEPGGNGRRPTRMQLSPKAIQIVSEAIGGRQHGPAFLTAKGVRWTIDNLKRQFARARRKAGITKDVSLWRVRPRRMPNETSHSR